MASLILVVFSVFLAVIPIFFHLLTRAASGHSSKKLPPGSLGLPVIGHSLSFLRARRANSAEEWLQRRVKKYGAVSKLSLFGKPTVFVTGPSANKFVFTNEALTHQQPVSMSRILGKGNIFELLGKEHKRVRGAIEQFLRPEILKEYIVALDEEVNAHLKMNWSGRKYVTVLPMMKRLTFDIMCSLVFGLQKGCQRDKLFADFTDILPGFYSVPLDIPFTCFNKSLQASRRARKLITPIIQQRKLAVEKDGCASHDDLISHLLSSDNGEEKSNRLTEEEIVNNTMLLLVAGYDNTAILITLMVRHLANDEAVRTAVIHEQEQVSKSKVQGEPLTWDDLLKMKYTWRVAMETLRMIPPVFGTFRTALKDVEFGGYLIPKGWQVYWATCSTQMDANIFEEPSRFDPARFESQSWIPPYSFVAFGGGQRICPGNEFVKIEVLVVMHYLVTQFRWKLCCKSDAISRNPSPSPSQGLPIELEKKYNIPLIPCSSMINGQHINSC